MSTPGVSPPFMLGTSASFTGGGTGSANDTLSLMNSIRTQDMSVTQQPALRSFPAPWLFTLALPVAVGIPTKQALVLGGVTLAILSTRSTPR